jgi:hypothetical protein
MLKRSFLVLLCSVIFIAKVHAQEVIVAREKSAEPQKQTPEPRKQRIQHSDELRLETPTPETSKVRKKKPASATLTLDQMRAGGARAADGLNNQPVSKSTKTREPDTVSAPAPVVIESSRPAKRETLIEQGASFRSLRSRSTARDGIGPIRPTMMESGRETPSPSP